MRLQVSSYESQRGFSAWEQVDRAFYVAMKEGLYANE